MFPPSPSLTFPRRSSGVTAVIVYPMNALINFAGKRICDVQGELFRKRPDGTFPLRSGQYTGQEDDGRTKNCYKDRRPRILLTNYMMLELPLGRGSKSGPFAMRSTTILPISLVFLTKLHTYRGSAKGADVAMLIRPHSGPNANSG